MRALVALALLAALAVTGALWYRGARETGRWQVVERPAEGFRFRLPPGWAPAAGGFADPAFRAGRVREGMLLTARSFAIPPEMRTREGRPEAAAVEAWAEGRRAQALGSERILGERRLRIAGTQAVLQRFEDPREALRYSLVAAVAREGRLYTFTAQAGSVVGPRDAGRRLRGILRTVEWR